MLLHLVVYVVYTNFYSTIDGQLKNTLYRILRPIWNTLGVVDVAINAFYMYIDAVV